MEIGDLLGKIIFDFSEARTLREEKHEQAFIQAFVTVVGILEGLMHDIGEVECRIKAAVDFSANHQYAKGKPNVYSFSWAVFSGALDSIGHEIYMSESFEVDFLFRGSSVFSS